MNEIKLSSRTSFLKIMGANPINRVLDFLIENERTSWSMVEISKNANVGYSTLKIILPKMLETNLIKVVKKIGKIKLYVINKESSIVKKLFLLHKEIMLTEIQKV